MVVGQVEEGEGGEGDERRDGVEQIVAEDKLLGGEEGKRGDERWGRRGKGEQGGEEWV